MSKSIQSPRFLRCKILYHSILQSVLYTRKMPALAPIVLKFYGVERAGYDSINQGGAITEDWAPGQQLLIEIRRPKTAVPTRSNSGGAGTLNFYENMRIVWPAFGQPWQAKSDQIRRDWSGGEKRRALFCGKEENAARGSIGRPRKPPTEAISRRSVACGAARPERSVCLGRHNAARGTEAVSAGENNFALSKLGGGNCPPPGAGP